MVQSAESLELTRLNALESVIQDGIEGFYKVGVALNEIRNERLYKELGYSSFETYCSDRWQMSRARAHQLMSASQLVGLSTTVDSSEGEIGLSEWNLRPIINSGLPENKKTEVLERVVDEARKTGDKVTAAKTQRAVEEVKYRGEPVTVVSKDRDGVIEAEDSEGNFMVFHSSEVTPVEPVRERTVDVPTTTHGDCFEELEVCEIRCKLLEDTLGEIIAWFDAQALDKDGAIETIIQQARELIVGG